jgi:hypothetical protein
MLYAAYIAFTGEAMQHLVRLVLHPLHPIHIKYALEDWHFNGLVTIQLVVNVAALKMEEAVYWGVVVIA